MTGALAFAFGFTVGVVSASVFIVVGLAMLAVTVPERISDGVPSGA